MAHTVFVYGTLQSEEIVQILLNRNPESYKGEAPHRLELQKWSFFLIETVSCSEGKRL